MPNHIILSICIPTYNRAGYIGETIESIINNIPENMKNRVEIVIRDNASTDNTMNLINDYKTIFSDITFHQCETNEGPDKNFIKVVDLAKGDYCWLFGSDDVMTSGAIRRMIDEIMHGYDIYLCNRVVCGSNLEQPSKCEWLKPTVGDSLYNFSNEEDLKNYLASAISLGAIFSYLSSIVFKRERWQSVVFNEAFIGTAYSHAFMLLSIVNQGAFLKYIKEPLVMCRSGNDSFSSEGLTRRLILDCEGYYLLSTSIFSDDEIKRKLFLKVMTREHSWARLLKARSFSRNNEWELLKEHLYRFGYNSYLLELASIMGKLKPIIILASSFKGRLKSMIYKIKSVGRP